MENAGINSEELVEKALQKVKEKRVGAKVFCICCGAGKRSPLRKWRTNKRTGDAIYICSGCWKIKEQIGEEQFEKALIGNSQ